MVGPDSEVMLVDDDPSVRRALTRLLRAAGFKVSSYASAEEYLDRYNPATPSCLILDLAMPGLGGLDLQSALVAREYAPPIIFLAGQATVPDSVQALKRGAYEFFTKPIEEQVLLEAVRRALEFDRSARRRKEELAQLMRRLSSLTPRESEVFKRVVAGKLNKQIAHELGTVEKTVKVHRGRVMDKLGARSLAELVAIAVRFGVCDAHWDSLTA